MIVVKEKDIMLYFPHLEELKLVKIKECYEKAIVSGKSAAKAKPAQASSEPKEPPKAAKPPERPGAAIKKPAPASSSASDGA